MIPKWKYVLLMSSHSEKMLMMTSCWKYAFKIIIFNKQHEHYYYPQKNKLLIVLVVNVLPLLHQIVLQ